MKKDIAIIALLLFSIVSSAQESLVATKVGSQWVYIANVVNVANLAIDNATDTVPEFVVDSFSLRADTVINLYGHYRDTAGIGACAFYVEIDGTQMYTKAVGGDDVSYVTCYGTCSICDEVRGGCKCGVPTGTCLAKTMGFWPVDGISNAMRTILNQ